MYCKHCGTQLPEGGRFCSNCCAPIDYDYNTGGRSYVPNQSMPFTPINGTPLSNYRHTTNMPIKKRSGCLPIFLILFAILMAFGIVNAFIFDIISESNAIVCEVDANLQYTSNGYNATLTFGDGSKSEGYKIPAGTYKVKGSVGCIVLGEYNLDGITKWKEVGWIVADGGQLQAAWVDLYDFVGGDISYHWGDKSDYLTIDFPFDVFITMPSSGQLTFIPQ